MDFDALTVDAQGLHMLGHFLGPADQVRRAQTLVTPQRGSADGLFFFAFGKNDPGLARAGPG